MASPKHLWSGDWERESAAADAARDGAPLAPAQPPPLAPPPPTPTPSPARAPAPPPGAARRPAPAPPGPRGPDARRFRRRIIALSLIGALIVIGVAVAVTSGGSSNNGRAGTGTTASVPGGYTERELGLVLQSVPVNRVIVQAVVPGSPADQAGIGASAVLLSVNGHQITSPDQVDSLLSHIPQGHTVTLELDQGPAVMTVGIALARTNAGP